MRFARSTFGMLGLTAILSCCPIANARGSEVLDILSDLDSDIRGGYKQLVDCQTRLDQLQLGAQLQGQQQQPLTKAAADIDALGSAALRSMQELRRKVTKLDEMRPNLEERFPEDQPRIQLYFEGSSALLSKSESLYQAIREDLDQARSGLVESYSKKADSQAREEKLVQLRERHRKREQAIANAEKAGGAPPEGETRGLAAGISAVDELGHPPLRPAAPRSARAAGPGSVTVDLEQLIQEMEK